MMVRPPESVEVQLDLELVSVAGTWELNNTERAAAWLHVELITRAGVAPLQRGLLRAAMTSLYSLFGISREALRRYDPDVAEPKHGKECNLGYLVVVMLNYAVRPVLFYRHPENRRDRSVSPLDHKRARDRTDELRAALDTTWKHLAAYAGLLAAACGVPALGAAIPTPSQP
ncbi:hypothetical protein O7631_07260 [Micromonospora sp. WMMD967]|uniref:hypothetical protein n=1 Tax=Micromonospora sp. WMMD967 TaxID=3016101 RepID=UPI0024178419|nr:hypothetical protein [Micromonospora sp. WMMD967]MDG4836310.1 hypothetical protein [Micromonospora sp. WMMD967]